MSGVREFFNRLFCRHETEIKLLKVHGSDEIRGVISVCRKCDKVVDLITSDR